MAETLYGLCRRFFMLKEKNLKKYWNGTGWESYAPIF